LSQSGPQQYALSLVQIATGIGIFVFWLEFFTVGTVAAQPGCYFAFEHAFPLPDTILALALVTSGANVIKGSIWGPCLSLICAGGLLFLGFLDLSFRVENGALRAPIVDVLRSLIIPVWCVAVGLLIFAIHRRRLHTFTGR
jgi:hypothetical protein